MNTTMRTRMAFGMARRPALIKGPCPLSDGGEAASEAGAQWVEAAWNREDFKPISRSALKDV
jgi:hypothetical protein